MNSLVGRIRYKKKTIYWNLKILCIDADSNLEQLLIEIRYRKYLISRKRTFPLDLYSQLYKKHKKNLTKKDLIFGVSYEKLISLENEEDIMDVVKENILKYLDEYGM